MTTHAEDPYVVLGVPHDATETEIHRAYKKLSLVYHPDRHPDKAGDSDFRSKFQSIVEAYQTLSDPERRKKYDSSFGLNFSHRVQDIRNKLAAAAGSTMKRPRDESSGSGAVTPAPETRPDDQDDDEDEYIPDCATTSLPDDIRFGGLDMSPPLRFELTRRASDGSWGLSLHETSDKCAVEILSVPEACRAIPVPCRIHSIGGKIAPSIADVAAALSTGIRVVPVDVELPLERVTVSNLTMSSRDAQTATGKSVSVALASLSLGEDFVIGVPPRSGHHALEVLRGRRLVTIDGAPIASHSDGILRLACVTGPTVELGLFPKPSQLS